MPESVIVAIIAVSGVVIAALLTFLTTKRSSYNTRVSHLETRLDKSELVNKGMWIWNIGLQAQVQRGDPPPPLQAPEWLQKLLDT